MFLKAHARGANGWGWVLVTGMFPRAPAASLFVTGSRWGREGSGWGPATGGARLSSCPRKCAVSCQLAALSPESPTRFKGKFRHGPECKEATQKGRHKYWRRGSIFAVFNSGHPVFPLHRAPRPPTSTIGAVRPSACAQLPNSRRKHMRACALTPTAAPLPPRADVVKVKVFSSGSRSVCVASVGSTLNVSHPRTHQFPTLTHPRPKKKKKRV